MADEDDPDDIARRILEPMDDAYLKFLRNEGLDMLSLFRRIRDPDKRKLIVDLMEAVSDAQPDVDGGSS